MVKIIKEKCCWNSVISQFDKSDVYHTFDYHHITKELTIPKLLVYSEGNVLIAMPLLIRKIPNSKFYDATSVYGYPGPLGKNIPQDFDNTKFLSAINDFFLERNIVSVFSRLNPFIPNQQFLLKNLGVMDLAGPIVSINLEKSIDLQRQDFNRRLKGHLNKIRRLCTIKVATTDTEYQEFKEIYYENMDRVNAKPMYYFDQEYFDVLTKSNAFNTKTLLALDNATGETIGGTMFISKNDVMHYHLGCARTKSLHLMPVKLLIDEMRLKATKLGYRELNLGGGLGSAYDSLLKFKSYFSKNYLDFYTWRYIVNPEAYDDLIASNNITNNSQFFPLYRYNEY